MTKDDTSASSTELARVALLALGASCIACAVAVIAQWSFKGEVAATELAVDLLWVPSIAIMINAHLDRLLRGKRRPGLWLIASATVVASLLTMLTR